MPIKEQIYYSLSIIISIVLILIGYKLNDDNFWKYYDSGFLLLALTFFIFMIKKKYYIISVAILILVSFILNSWITSMFFNVTKIEENQKILGWVLAILLFLLGGIYNVISFILEQKQLKKDLECKKDARDKYKMMLHKIDKVDTKLKTLLNKHLID